MAASSTYILVSLLPMLIDKSKFNNLCSTIYDNNLCQFELALAFTEQSFLSSQAVTVMRVANEATRVLDTLYGNSKSPSRVELGDSSNSETLLTWRLFLAMRGVEDAGCLVSNPNHRYKAL